MSQKQNYRSFALKNSNVHHTKNFAEDGLNGNKYQCGNFLAKIFVATAVISNSFYVGSLKSSKMLRAGIFPGKIDRKSKLFQGSSKINGIDFFTSNL
jgi:hypothetical protein